MAKEATSNPPLDDDAEWQLRERDPAFIASIANARKQVAQGKTLRHGELAAKLDNWLKPLAGSMQGHPEFDEVLALGIAARKKLRKSSRGGK